MTSCTIEEVPFDPTDYDKALADLLLGHEGNTAAFLTSVFSFLKRKTNFFKEGQEEAPRKRVLDALRAVGGDAAVAGGDGRRLKAGFLGGASVSSAAKLATSAAKQVCAGCSCGIVDEGAGEADDAHRVMPDHLWGTFPLIPTPLFPALLHLCQQAAPAPSPAGMPADLQPPAAAAGTAAASSSSPRDALPPPADDGSDQDAAPGSGSSSKGLSECSKATKQEGGGRGARRGCTRGRAS